ncbi:MAG TPA: plastocyanin/azurin family copper-binding protein [Gemmatimonadales bacterium]|nr:plastocyanin/azurin family copper-binding protein [Gemmatimonadales bacterium]
MATRRGFLQAGGAVLAGLALPPWWRAPRPFAPVVEIASVVEIAMRSDPLGSKVWFDPVGILVEPGTTIRWVVRENVHTTTAYHPKNGHHSLRIPEGAEPWDSGFLVNPGDHFAVTLTVPGVYDFFCMPHEAAGMVGRVVVGKSGGPGALPFDYFKGKASAADWLAIPEAAQQMFPGVDRILRERIVHGS